MTKRRRSGKFEDNDFRALLDSLPHDRPLSKTQCRKAALAVAARSEGVADATHLLQALGLIPTPPRDLPDPADPETVAAFLTGENL